MPDDVTLIDWARGRLHRSSELARYDRGLAPVPVVVACGGRDPLPAVASARRSARAAVSTAAHLIARPPPRRPVLDARPALERHLLPGRRYRGRARTRWTSGR